MKKVLLMSIALLLVCSCASFALEFSATWKMVNLKTLLPKTEKGKAPEAMEGFAGMLEKGSKMYVSGDKTRMEMPMNAVSITRFDKKVMWTLTDAFGNKTYTEDKMDPKVVANGNLYVTRDFGKLGKKMGKEMMNGVMCDKYKLIRKQQIPTEKQGVYKEGKKDQTVYTWISKDGIMMRSVASYGENGQGPYVGMEIVDLKMGPQPASLFEVPAGYSKQESSN